MIGWLEIIMNNEERFKASTDQILTYSGSQYRQWRVAVVKSIRKILLNLDVFYNDILSDIETGDETQDIVHCQIRNGWFYEAVAHAVQAIEDLFSTLMCIDDLSFFTKDVLRYPASKAKRYIWNFDADNLKYLADQFLYPYFSLDEVWESKECFEAYKNGVLFTQKCVKELQAFHQKYYDDYNQYKHGLSVGLTPVQNPLMKGDEERRKQIMLEPLMGALYTFHNGTIEDYQKRTGALPAIMIQLKHEMQPHISELHKEKNLLFSTIHVVNMDEVVKVTEHACILLDVVWLNIVGKCGGKETDVYQRVALPIDSLKRYCEIGF